MQHAVFRKILAVLFGLVLAAPGLWASPAGEAEPAAAMEKEMGAALLGRPVCSISGMS